MRLCSCPYAYAYAQVATAEDKKWVRSSYVSAYAYAYVAGVLTYVWLCYAYALVRTRLFTVSRVAAVRSD